MDKCGADLMITKDFPAKVLSRMSPRRRRLFGDLGENAHPTDYYKPKDQIEIICSDEWQLSI